MLARRRRLHLQTNALELLMKVLRQTDVVTHRVGLVVLDMPQGCKVMMQLLPLMSLMKVILMLNGVWILLMLLVEVLTLSGRGILQVMKLSQEQY